MFNLEVDFSHTYHVGQNGLLVHNSCARGGVYTLTDELSGKVVRTGRTNDFARRQAEHKRGALKGYKFNEIHETNDYATQRGLEHLLYEAHYKTAAHVNKGFNKIRAMSVKTLNSSKGQNYIDAAEAFLNAN